MPKGIVVKVTAVELKAHLEKRVAHHDERAKFYFAEAKRHKDEAERLQSLGEMETSTITKSSYGNSRNLQEQNRTQGIAHYNSAKKLKFLAEHIMDEDYELTTHDLNSVEFIASDY